MSTPTSPSPTNSLRRPSPDSDDTFPTPLQNKLIYSISNLFPKTNHFPTRRQVRDHRLRIGKRLARTENIVFTGHKLFEYGLDIIAAHAAGEMDELPTKYVLSSRTIFR